MFISGFITEQWRTVDEHRHKNKKLATEMVLLPRMLFLSILTGAHVMLSVQTNRYHNNDRNQQYNANTNTSVVNAVFISTLISETLHVDCSD